MISLRLEQFDWVSVCTQLQNHATTLSAHGDEDNARECIALRDKLRSQLKEQTNG